MPTRSASEQRQQSSVEKSDLAKTSPDEPTANIRYKRAISKPEVLQWSDSPSAHAWSRGLSSIQAMKESVFRRPAGGGQSRCSVGRCCLDSEKAIGTVWAI